MIVYHSGREVHFAYAAGTDKNLTRVTSLATASSGRTDLAKYTYFGTNGIVKVDYTEPFLLYSLAEGGGDDPLDGEGAETGGLDRFGRRQAQAEEQSFR